MYSTGSALSLLLTCPAGGAAEPYRKDMIDESRCQGYCVSCRPPQPDFQIVVINARTAFVPSLYELTELFNVLPEIPPPLPRKRGTPTIVQSSPAAVASPVHTSTFRHIFSWLLPLSTVQSMPSQPRPHPFAALKAGRKNIVVAVVDSGNISFFRFSQGAFEEWPTL